MLRLSLPLLGLAGLLLPAAASAQTPYAWGPPPPPYGYAVPQDQVTVGAYGRTWAQACVRWCQHDDVPCDPPSFKIADNRCGAGRFRR